MMEAVPEMDAQAPLTGSRKDMFVSVGWTVRSMVLPEKRFVWNRRSMPPFSCRFVSSCRLALLGLRVVGGCAYLSGQGHTP